MYHGIIIDQEFKDPSFPKTFKSFAYKQDGSWGIYGVEVEDLELEEVIAKVQKNLREDQPWYCHFYSDKRLVVVFKDKTFDVTPLAESWGPVTEYGRKLNIREEQLDFSPNRFQDEPVYFAKKDL